MRRNKSLIVEPLECRALLAGLTGLSHLSASLTTNQSVYQVGEPVRMTFTFTNSGNTPASFDYGPSFDGFVVSQGGQTVWQSNAGLSSMIAIEKTLQPGQSFSLQTMWDGMVAGSSNSNTLTGSFVVTDQLDTTGASATFQIDAPLPPAAPTGPTVGQPDPPSNPSPPLGSLPSDPPPPTGITPTDPPPSTGGSQPTPNPPSVTAIVTTDHATSHAGKPVRIKITLKNIAKTNAQLASHAGADGITVLEGSTVVARTTKSLLTTKAKTLKPGQSLQLTTLWNGKVNQAGLKKLNAGTYTIVVDEGGYRATTNVNIK
jgi:hypothetical protein